MAPGQVTSDDILEFDLDGAPLNANGRPVYLERFIHSEIYRARPDAMAIVHSHSHSIVPLSISKTARLRAVFHMAGFIGEEAPLFEIRDTAGPATDLLISNPGLGRALAQCCGGHNIVLMRGHGSTVIGESLRQAIYRAVYAELNARYQCEAMGLGEVVYLTKEEGETAVRTVEQQSNRAWNSLEGTGHAKATGGRCHRNLNLRTRSPEVLARAHAAVAARHVRNASSLRTRSVLRDVRWRWTLNVLWTAA